MTDLELWIVLLLVFLGGMLLIYPLTWVAGALRQRRVERQKMEYIWRRRR
jgi:hypothetical protein